MTNYEMKRRQLQAKANRAAAQQMQKTAAQQRAALRGSSPAAAIAERTPSKPEYKKGLRLVRCIVCTVTFTAVRSDAEMCSAACRKVWSNHSRGFGRYLQRGDLTPEQQRFRHYLRVAGVIIKNRRQGYKGQ